MTKDVIRRNLVAHLAELVRERDPFLATQGHFYVQQYLCEQLGQWTPVVPQVFLHRGQTYTNWCIHLPGQAGHDLAPLLVGAHYDTVPGTLGADDNATGLAVLLELARLWHQAPGHRPLWLIAFDLEEYGLIGSQAYVQELLRQHQPLHLMLSLEMLGYCDPTPGSQQYPAGLGRIYPTTGDFLALIGNWQRIPTLIKLKAALQSTGTACEWLPMVAAGKPLPAVRRSDHAPFWDAGYDAVLMTDTADLRNPHYHGPGDTLATLDLDFLTGICAGLYAGLQQL
ncbi:MAG: M28 family peptidase [Cyanobacteria bacterium J06632_22]